MIGYVRLVRLFLSSRCRRSRFLIVYRPPSHPETLALQEADLNEFLACFREDLRPTIHYLFTARTSGRPS